MPTLAAMMIGDPARLAKLVVFLGAMTTLTGAVVWTLWLIVIIRRDVHRANHGCCMQCGYDLSHSEGRCPECGAVIRH